MVSRTASSAWPSEERVEVTMTMVSSGDEAEGCSEATLLDVSTRPAHGAGGPGAVGIGGDFGTTHRVAAG